jgi:hypothetical protein
MLRNDTSSCKGTTHAVMAYLLLFGGHNCDVGFSVFVAKIFEFLVSYARSGNPRSVLLAAMMAALIRPRDPNGWRVARGTIGDRPGSCGKVRIMRISSHVSPCQWLRDLRSDRP